MLTWPFTACTNAGSLVAPHEMAIPCRGTNKRCRATQSAVRDGKLSGTWEMGADGPRGAPPPTEAVEVAGQITMRMSWRPVAAA